MNESSTTPLELQDIDPAIDFPALARCMLEAYEDPPQPFFHIFFPIHEGNQPQREAREKAIQEASERLQLWHTHDPTSHWQKIVDLSTGRIVGGAAWNIFDKGNPFAPAAEEGGGHGEPLEVTWFPDDGSRRWVEQALEMYGMPRYEVAQRKHLYLFNVFTHPDFRRQGVSQTVMDWGANKADELGLDTFLDSTPPGKPLYEKNGFITIKENVTFPVPTAEGTVDDKWKQTAQKVGPFTFWLMWRPVGGNYEEGTTIKPWEVDWDEGTGVI